ncbi:hemin uptake protein HemP [bacterium]|nr:hemin uptake protein HemP [bacterium]
MRQEAQRELDTRQVQRTGSAPFIFSSALFAGGNEVFITHGYETYRLRETRQGKLILTK